jgi:hypothetical protein
MIIYPQQGSVHPVFQLPLAPRPNLDDDSETKQPKLPNGSMEVNNQDSGVPVQQTNVLQGVQGWNLFLGCSPQTPYVATLSGIVLSSS